MSVSKVTFSSNSGMPPAPDEELKFCDQCGEKEANLKLCGRCQMVYYCGAECQKAAWNTHKLVCKRAILLNDFEIQAWASRQLNRFPANSCIKIKNIPEIDFEKNRDDSVAMEDKQRLLPSILSNILMIRHFSLRSITLTGSCYLHTFFQGNKRNMIFGSDEPYEISIHKTGILKGYASYFFEELKRQEASEFSLSSNEQLFFYDITPEERDLLIKNPQQIKHWLLSKAPIGTEIRLKGHLCVNPAVIDMFAGDIKIPAIVLSTRSSCTFEFNWKFGGSTT